VATSFPYRRGQIVWADIRDPDGRVVDHEHPAVIISNTDNLTEFDQVVVVVVSSKLREPLPDHWVPLPWHPDPRRVRTRLDRPCVAKCDWLAAVRLEDIKRASGTVSGEVLERITRIVRESSGG
jgi:mRNA-degrading endonuclease toxin of MazEF toxin-antitoxin module